ncbi:DnaJ domain-containing protein [Leptospira sp. 2 VSF19]|uniref:DnaJ domain-containing protein n=1 Tax=Leptospira soteropolitanensis TaxID=2950025 RepID=A0AAW5VEA6_9LEPT|nr:DnaJ domain-containing protein [Leptospira soteropolitanensis]MCW7492071.1 DnaJ domain-containing protein [Leptospira soteropolitanensis]MCW7499653.1 DnaJ domain-containing protein [Leptospira soteropolitanensis]MCW7521904.1 DnaJ domain-containing protein [Leptospira soteropolitanensis]MCW7525758.1 DnaJ domain-containing protein [Leptospira soteropolitanensis]MCW7530128.1 DnaJ domain-containing protein [Leptospira soteropolitanensis]
MARTKRETFYGILGVTKESAKETVEAIYSRELEFWQKLDNAGIPEAKEKILELTRAYFTLSDPQKKAEYDKHLDFEFVLLDGKAKDPEIEEAYDVYRLSHQKSYQEILKEFTKFREEMGDTLWILKKTTIYMVFNLLVYSGFILYHSFLIETKENGKLWSDVTSNWGSGIFLFLSGLGYLFFRFRFLKKELEKRKEKRN